MTVGELIRELQRYPPNIPVALAANDEYIEQIQVVLTTQLDQTPIVVLEMDDS